MEFGGVWHHEVASSNVGRQRTRRNGCGVVAAVQDMKPRFERLGKKLECVGVFLDCLYLLWFERHGRRMDGSRLCGKCVGDVEWVYLHLSWLWQQPIMAEEGQ